MRTSSHGLLLAAASGLLVLATGRLGLAAAQGHRTTTITFAAIDAGTSSVNSTLATDAITSVPVDETPLTAAIAVPAAPLVDLSSGVIRIQPRVASPQDAGVAATAGGGIDPVDLGFLGGSQPNTAIDLPVTIVFLVLFATGAFTHISIYQANSKRGHKFLLSDLMFDFCMVRIVSCIFRIIWVFIHPRGVVLCAQLFFNGGAAVIFAVNIILTQRIVRAMHPRFGWSRGFSIGTRILALSVPVNIVFQIISIIVFFFSTGDANRLGAFGDCLKVGSSWNLFLVSFPFIAISVACAVPGPRPEKFGVGSLRVKTSLILLVSVMLGTGATVRAYFTFNPRSPANSDVLYSKAVFYTTQFTLEILVVFMYAALRIDKLFHIPNGSSAPGHYTYGTGEEGGDPEKAKLLTRADIEERIANCGVPHQILRTSYHNDTTLPGVEQPLYAIFFPSTVVKASAQAVEEALKNGKLIQRPSRVSRRQSLVEALDRTRSTRSERDRKAVGRSERRSAALRRSHWGYAHLQNDSSRSLRSGYGDLHARTPPADQVIAFEPVHEDEWVLPEYPRDENSAAAPTQTTQYPMMSPAPAKESRSWFKPSTSTSTYQESSTTAASSNFSYDRTSWRSSASWSKKPRETVQSVQVEARGSTGSTTVPAAPPSRPHGDLEPMYHAA